MGLDIEAWDWPMKPGWDPKHQIKLFRSGLIAGDFIGIPEYLLGE